MGIYEYLRMMCRRLPCEAMRPSSRQTQLWTLAMATPVSPYSAVSPRWLAAVLALTAQAWCVQAQAQSAYTMTVLNKPSGATSFVPTSIDQSGVVRGGMYYSAGFLFTNGGIGSCWICPQYLPRDVSWPASTGTSVAATTGTSGFFSVASNNKGTMVGGYEPGSKSFGQGALGELGVRIPNTSWKLLRSVTNIYSGIKRNGTVTPLALPPESATSTYYGYSYTLTGLNNNDVLLGNKTGSSTDNPGRAYTWAVQNQWPS